MRTILINNHQTYVSLYIFASLLVVKKYLCKLDLLMSFLKFLMFKLYCFKHHNKGGEYYSKVNNYVVLIECLLQQSVKH